MNGPNGSSASSRNMNGGYPRSAPWVVFPHRQIATEIRIRMQKEAMDITRIPETVTTLKGLTAFPQEPLPYN